MKIVAWVAEGTWEACVDAAGALAGDDDEVVLVHVTDPDVLGPLAAAYRGLLRPADDSADGTGRAERTRRAELAVRAAADASAEALLAGAGARLAKLAAMSGGRWRHRLVRRTGRPGREVAAAAADAGVLVLVRAGTPSRRPHRGLGAATRFVLDHATCRVLLVRPGSPIAAPAGPPAVTRAGCWGATLPRQAGRRSV